MKKIMNAPKDLVREMGQGMVLADPELVFSPRYRIICRKHISSRKVMIISGGGSGHEPAHAGFVGKGMLDVAVCGNVFASPSQAQIYQAIRQTANQCGTLLIIKNYSGDMMNFTLAADMARDDGVKVEWVCVNDDVAVQDSLYTVGRRGVAGTVLIHKLAGAAAERGLSLEQVKSIAEEGIANTKSIGVALTSCTVPTKGSPTFELGNDEIEYGVGIHGEPGICRKKLAPSKEISQRMVEDVLRDLPTRDPGTEVAVLINGFGGTPLQELYVLAYDVAQYLRDQEMRIFRMYVGNYLTSLDMAGASVSLMVVNEQRKSLLGDPCKTSALSVDGTETYGISIPKETEQVQLCTCEDINIPISYTIIERNCLSFKNILCAINTICKTAIQKEKLFCQMDSAAGDGDFGTSLASGFLQVKNEWNDLENNSGEDIGVVFDKIAMILMESCGGASGPIWGSAFRGAASAARGKHQLSLPELTAVMEKAAENIYKTGERAFGRGAVLGDKTLMDALIPCVGTLKKCVQNQEQMKTALEKGALAASEGAEKTKEIVARLGRAGTVGMRSIGHPDAGAYALSVIFSEVAARFKACVAD